MMADVTKEERWRELALDIALRVQVAAINAGDQVSAEEAVKDAEVYRKFLAGEKSDEQESR